LYLLADVIPDIILIMTGVRGVIGARDMTVTGKGDMTGVSGITLI